MASKVLQLYQKTTILYLEKQLVMLYQPGLARIKVF